MNKIQYLQDGNDTPVLDVITQIARQGMEGDHEAQMLAKYIAQGLNVLESIDIPANKRYLWVTQNEQNNPISFNILKDLTSAQPLLEFRINRSEPGAFRAIFFEYEYQGDRYLVFTQALIKTGDPNPPELQAKIQRSLEQYQEVVQHPDHYLEGSG